MALNVDSAVDFAQDTSGLFPGLCDRFVASAYGVNKDAAGTAHSGYKSAWVHWNATPAKYRRAGNSQPPIGALVYWSNAVGDGYGHVAIVTGKDKDGNVIITSTHANGGRPTEFRLKDVMPSAYLGWATPYFQGRTAKLDQASLDKAVIDVGADPQGAAATSTGQSMDTLSPKEAAETQGFTWEFVKSHPEVREVFEEAIAQDWFNGGEVGKLRFQNAIQATTWAKNNSTFAQQYFLNKAKGGEVWNEQVRVAEEFVRQTATKMGVKLDDAQLRFFANQTLMNGWNTSGRESFLPQALTGSLSYKDQKGRTHVFQTDFLNYEAGGPAATMQTLKNVAWQNGVEFNDGFYKGAARAVASGLGSVDDYVAQVRKAAASKSPWWAAQIEAGANARDLASAHIGVYAKMRGIDPNSVSMDDPNLKGAFNMVDAKGNAGPMGLWDYEKSLRQKEWYQYSQDAHERVGSLVGKLGAIMGFGGSQ